jgi:deazaflavin-dependent oxidoreductase (nitroreductase family)
MSETSVVPVGPSLAARLVMKPLTKLLNPLVATMAGRRHFSMAAQLHHVGRRSAKPYMTPVGARLHNGIILIPMTFGTTSDWARNVQAAGQCTLRIDGNDYQAVAPQFLTSQQAAPMLRPYFRPIERLMFKALGIRQFMCLQLAH